jgi:Dyp-type peroxidase family
MLTTAPVREAPFTVQNVAEDQTETQMRPLALDEIQGNILAGFNKDFQTLLFLKIEEPEVFKLWLEQLVPFVATTREVLHFNRLFKELRVRRGIETRAVMATWLNIAFSSAGLRKVTSDVEDFQDVAFKEGLAARSKSLNDPDSGVGSQDNWLVGGVSNVADVVLIVASDSAEELAREVTSLETRIFDGACDKGGNRFASGATIIFKQNGATLADPLRGHEHFGFLDGVSQPGVRGTSEGELFMPRQNPANRNQGKPGQDCLWPGEFVFGYPGQDENDADKPGPVKTAGPEWGDNGSFLVFRRLRQDVGGFHEFLKSTAKTLGIDAGLFGAKCVGRWASGAPIERAPNLDNPQMSRDDCANNAFDFQNGTTSAAPTQPGDCRDNFPANPAKADALGALCPFSGHIRKSYPRDDLKEAEVERHRLIRRGIPFGDAFDATVVPDRGERGLLFLAYQTSIENQFEFITKNWVNNPDFLHAGSGHDPILGQAGGNRARSFTLSVDGKKETVSMTADWVVPTGGGYFFAPSISALKSLCGR